MEFLTLLAKPWLSKSIINVTYKLNISEHDKKNSITELMLTYNKDVNLGSDTFGKPIFQKCLQN